MRPSPFATLERELVDPVAIAAITGYQRYLSPHKGFRCAHRTLHQGESCSHYVKRIVYQEGLSIALKKSRVRFAACKEANRILQARHRAYQMSINDEAPGNTEGENAEKEKVAPAKQQRYATSSSDWNCDDCLACGDLSRDCVTVDCSSYDTTGLDCSGCDSGCGDFGGCGN